MKSMKKMISSLLIAVTLMTVMPAKKADAAVLVFGVSTMTMDFPDVTIGWSVAMFTAAAAVVVGGVVAIFNPAMGLKTGGILLALDADGSLPQIQLESELAKKLPFINDRQIISELSNAVKKDFDKVENTEKGVLVSLSEKQVKDILLATDLELSQIDEVVELLK